MPDTNACCGSVAERFSPGSSGAWYWRWHRRPSPKPGAGRFRPRRTSRSSRSRSPISTAVSPNPETVRRPGVPRRPGADLASADFGGWSALIMAPDGKSLLAVSDVGGWLTADLAYEDGRPARLSRARIGPLLSASGNLLKARSSRTPKAPPFSRAPCRNGTLLISFERHHRIGRFPIRDGDRAGADRHAETAGRGRAHARQPGHRGDRCRQERAPQGLGCRPSRNVLPRGSGYHTGWIWPPGGGAPQPLPACATSTASTSPMRRRCPMATCWSSSGASAGRKASRCACAASPARTSMPSAAPGRTHPARGGRQLPDRQHGGHGRAPQRRRRDHPHLDLRRQLQPLPAAHGAPAVHAA